MSITLNAKRKRRLMMVGLLVVGVGIAAALALSAFRENILYFYSPTEVLAGEAPVGHKFRLGGLVVEGSVKRETDGLTVHFGLTDTAKEIPVMYSGILPDLFREGQGIIANGQLDDQGQFVAQEVLAKHDENYMPPELMEAMQQRMEKQ